MSADCFMKLKTLHSNECLETSISFENEHKTFVMQCRQRVGTVGHSSARDMSWRYSQVQSGTKRVRITRGIFRYGLFVNIILTQSPNYQTMYDHSLFTI